MLDQFMHACDFLQWHALRNLKTTPYRSQGGFQVPRGGNLRLGREVVAADQEDPHVLGPRRLRLVSLG